MKTNRCVLRHSASAGLRGLKLWLLLLGMAELADLITTRADRLHGGIEANQFAAFTLGVGGPGLFWAVKLSVVVAMAAIVVLAVRRAREFPPRRANLIRGYVARSIQICALILTAAAMANLMVLA